MTMELWTNCAVATMQAGSARPYGLIDDAALVLDGERVLWVGERQALPAELRSRCLQQQDGGGALITPGLIDCHTHLVYAGDRAREFELRLNGASYEEIARSGGGIASTVRDTRAASPEALQAQSLVRLQALMQVARALGQTHAVAIRTTFLGAHAVPPEFAGRSDDYVDAVLAMLAQLHAEGLVDAVDAFCEGIGFSPAQTRRVFAAAQALGLTVKLHAEQLSDSGGAALAAGFGALSCDHLEWLSEEGAAAMAAAGTVAVLLPGAFYFVRETRLPPLALLRQHGVPMAIATDCNPGSSPCSSLLLMLNMACTLFRMTPEEALAGVTRHAAGALGLTDRGVIAPGMRADLVLWSVRHPAELSYAIGANPHRQTIFAGKLL
ncbi:MAG: amidohydrolase family protein [Burkholderiales bacterium]|nr:amidohydrolase family protein [Burkholderiales bacterium]